MAGVRDAIRRTGEIPLVTVRRIDVGRAVFLQGLVRMGVSRLWSRQCTWGQGLCTHAHDIKGAQSASCLITGRPTTGNCA